MCFCKLACPCSSRSILQYCHGHSTLLTCLTQPCPSTCPAILNLCCPVLPFTAQQMPCSAMQVLEGFVGCVGWGCLRAALGISPSQVTQPPPHDLSNPYLADLTPHQLLVCTALHLQSNISPEGQLVSLQMLACTPVCLHLAGLHIFALACISLLPQSKSMYRCSRF